MKQVAYILVAIALLSSNAQAGWDPEEKIPDAHVVQAALWKNMRFEDFLLEGIMRTDENLHPILLRTKNREMVFEFLKKPLQIRVELTPEGSIIHRRKKMGEPWKKLTHKEKLAKILDSDIAYEDLGVDFLRWKDVQPLGGDSIKTLDAWAYEARPNKASRYSKARYWISSDYLAVLRVDALNSKDQVVKRVEINGVQEVEGTEAYAIKELMFSSLIPGRDISKTRTYIEIRKAKQGSGLPD